MAARIVLFGATGYTGRLAAEAMVERGLQAGARRARPRSQLDAAGGRARRARDGGRRRVGSAERARAGRAGRRAGHHRRPVRALGRARRPRRPPPAGAHYIDSTGEPAFIREVFERYGPAAEQAGIGMLTAFGYDWVPGNLAGGLALDRAGDARDARGRRLLHHRQWREAERWHDGVAGGRDRRYPPSASATAACSTERGAKRVRELQGRRSKRAVTASRSAARSTSPCRGSLRSCAR